MDLNASNQGNTAGNKPQSAGLQGTAASSVHDVLEHADSTATADKVQPVVSNTPQAAHAPLYHAVHAAADAAGSMPHAEEDSFAGSATQYIRENPRRALTIAFVTGLFIGRIVL